MNRRKLQLSIVVALSSSFRMSIESTQPTFTCLKLTIETLEQGKKYVQINNKDTRTTLMAYFTPCSSVSKVE